MVVFASVVERLRCDGAKKKAYKAIGLFDTPSSRPVVSSRLKFESCKCNVLYMHHPSNASILVSNKTYEGYVPWILPTRLVAGAWIASQLSKPRLDVGCCFEMWGTSPWSQLFSDQPPERLRRSTMLAGILSDSNRSWTSSTSLLRNRPLEVLRYLTHSILPQLTSTPYKP